MNKFRQLVFIDDDNPTNVYHKIIVEESNLCDEALFFESGVKALEYFKELIQQEDYMLPEMIFLDINMPVMSGWDFIKAFDQLQIKNPLFIVLLTTSLSTMDKEKADKLGKVHKFISKPLQVEVLQELNVSIVEST